MAPSGQKLHAVEQKLWGVYGDGGGRTVRELVPPLPGSDLPQCRARDVGRTSVHWLPNPLIVVLPPQECGRCKCCHSAAVLRIAL